jgi:dihydroorotase
MNSNIIIKNTRIIDPESEYDQIGDIIIRDGKIFDFGFAVSENFAKTPIKFDIINAQNLITIPGIVDMQVHFRDPGQEEKEDISTGSLAAVAGGITTIVCQPNTKPKIDNLDTLKYINDKAAKDSLCNILAYAAITANSDGAKLTDMKSLHDAGAVGFTDDGLPLMNSLLMKKAFLIAKQNKSFLAQHAEDIILSNGGCINEGKVSNQLGVKGISNSTESIIVARDIELLRQTNSKYHVLHVSAAESVNLIRAAKKEGLRITAEVSPHHLALTENDVLKIGTNAKMNPPLRHEKDRQALITALVDGTIDAIATDHAPHELAAKNKDLADAAFGVIGLETMLAVSLGLYHNGSISLIELLKKLTCNPSKILKIKKGRIAKNYDADLCIFDLNKKWSLSTGDIKSKSHNTPFLNHKFLGKNYITIVSGKIVYQDS